MNKEEKLNYTDNEIREIIKRLSSSIDIVKNNKNKVTSDISNLSEFKQEINDSLNNLETAISNYKGTQIPEDIKNSINDLNKKIISINDENDLEATESKKEDEKYQLVTVYPDAIQEVKNPKLSRRIIAGVVAVSIGVGTVCFFARGNKGTSNTSSNNEYSSVDDSSNEDVNNSSIADSSSEVIDSSSIDENYIDIDEFKKLLKIAGEKTQGIDITTSELASLIIYLNDEIIDDKLKNVIENCIIEPNGSNLEVNYINALNKIRNSNINAYTIKIDEELANNPEYIELINNLKNNSKKVYISEFVSKKSSNLRYYEFLDDMYDLLGESNTKEEAINFFSSLVSEETVRLPDEINNGIFDNYYSVLYDEITASNLQFLVTSSVEKVL